MDIQYCKARASRTIEALVEDSLGSTKLTVEAPARDSLTTRQKPCHEALAVESLGMKKLADEVLQ